MNNAFCNPSLISVDNLEDKDIILESAIVPVMVKGIPNYSNSSLPLEGENDHLRYTLIHLAIEILM